MNSIHNRLIILQKMIMISILNQIICWMIMPPTQAGESDPKPKRIALQMGGNCEKDFGREGENNIFLSSMGTERKMLENGNWEVQSLYNGNTDPFASKFNTSKSSGSIQPSTRENFLKQLDDLIERTSIGNRNDQQILISLKSHGNKGGICISETETMSYDDPELQKRLAQIQQKSKIGIIVDSCYSGSAIPALTRYGCVITSQTGNAFSVSDPSSDALKTLFVKSMGSNQSLSMEDLFLQMQATTSKTFPQMNGFNEGNQYAQAYLKQFSNLGEADWWQPIFNKSGETPQCESSTPLKSLRDWMSTSKELFTQERLNEYYSHDRVSKIELKSIAKKIELAQLQSQKFEKLSIKLDQIAHAIVDLKKPSAEEDRTEFEERYKILFNELVTVGNKLDQMKDDGPHYIGIKSNIPGKLSFTDESKGQFQEIKALNHFLSARYLQSLMEPNLTPQEKQARKNCQDFKLFETQ